ncbi:MAG: Nramp family divalent metal transporter [Candidatus Aenigmatarchaeota archaeon]
MAKVKKEVPEPISLKKFFFGPTIILFGLGLGAGELILWPQIAANYGLIFVWLAFFSLLVQTLWTIEMAKISLVTGEHFVLYMTRIFGLINSLIVFGIFTILAAGVPSWAINSAESLLRLYDFSLDYKTALFIWSLISFGIIILALTFADKISSFFERFFKILTLISWTFLIFLVINLELYKNIAEVFISLFTDFGSLRFDISMYTLASAVAFVGAGGIFNIWYTYWLRDIGWGMGKYVGSIKGIRKKQEKILIEPIFPKEDSENLERLSLWIKNFKIGFFSIYFILNFLTLTIFISLGYFLYGSNLEIKSAPIAISNYISQRLGEIFGIIYLFIVALQLFSTQFSITEGLIRQISDSIYIYFLKYRKKEIKINKLYFVLLLIFSLYGLLWIYITKISGYLNPDFLIKLSANIALIFQTFSIPLVLYYNYVVARRFLSFKVYQLIKPNLVVFIILMLGFLLYLLLSIMAWSEFFAKM